MRATGTLQAIEHSLEGQIIAKFAFEDDRQTVASLKELEGLKATIQAEKWQDRKSNQANAYLWVLCDKIAKAIGSTKDIVYEMCLKDAGVFEDKEVPRDTVKDYADFNKYRIIEPQYVFDAHCQKVEGLSVVDDVIEMVGLRCWRGSHTYNKQEMSHLINEVVYQAKELNIETATPDELAHMVSIWEARN